MRGERDVLRSKHVFVSEPCNTNWGWPTSTMGREVSCDWTMSEASYMWTIWNCSQNKFQKQNQWAHRYEQTNFWGDSTGRHFLQSAHRRALQSTESYKRYKVPKVTTTKKLGFSTKKENVVTSIGLPARPSHAQWLQIKFSQHHSMSSCSVVGFSDISLKRWWWCVGDDDVHNEADVEWVEWWLHKRGVWWLVKHYDRSFQRKIAAKHWNQMRTGVESIATAIIMMMTRKQRRGCYTLHYG